ncbi:MAG: 4Fe-4S binding protein, partial [Clostridiales bacterium]|nr:4Fe-4S binding protein [Clostridiales bacterium]
PRVKMPTLSPDERRSNFNEIVKGYSDEDAQREGSRCLECGCRDVFECKLLKISNEYDIEPLRFKGEKTNRFDGNKNEFIERDPDKCILCGLCVRACAEVMDVTALGLVGRGFSSYVSPEFGLPLDKTKCNNCGLCVKLCPTGALTERSLLKKQVPLDEKKEKRVCDLCDKRCSVEVATVGKKIIRVVPADEGSRNCYLGRNELIKRFVEKNA